MSLHAVDYQIDTHNIPINLDDIMLLAKNAKSVAKYFHDCPFCELFAREIKENAFAIVLLTKRSYATFTIHCLRKRNVRHSIHFRSWLFICLFGANLVLGWTA